MKLNRIKELDWPAEVALLITRTKLTRGAAEVIRTMNALGDGPFIEHTQIENEQEINLLSAAIARSLTMARTIASDRRA